MIFLITTPIISAALGAAGLIHMTSSTIIGNVLLVVAFIFSYTMGIRTVVNDDDFDVEAVEIE